MPRKGKRRKKTRTHVVDNSTAQNALTDVAKTPKSLVIRRGKVETEVSDLVHDLRQLMLPYTALHFKESPGQTLAKYCQHLALPMGVSHILELSQNDERLHLRVAKTPQGPTLTFRVKQFSLNRHVKKLQKHPVQVNHNQPPVVVTNNFAKTEAPPHVKLMRITFQNMFPAINVVSAKLNECKRVVLFHLDEQGTVQMRHYAIRTTTKMPNHKLQRLLGKRKVPNLGNVQDIADFVTQEGGNASDSEDEGFSVTTNSSSSSVMNTKALKLVELGPRLSLDLVKVEKGLADGNIMYHAFVTKSPHEVKEIEDRKQREAMQKQLRRQQQEENVERKRKAQEEKLERKRLKKEKALEELRGGQVVDDDDSEGEAE